CTCNWQYREGWGAAGDIVSWDYYPLTDPGNPAPFWTIYDQVQTARRLTHDTRPVMPFIETSGLFENGTVIPTTGQMEGEVFNALVGGARGIQYFDHDFQADPDINQSLLDSPGHDYARTAVATMDFFITNEWAPILNAPFVNQGAGSTAPLNIMEK